MTNQPMPTTTAAKLEMIEALAIEAEWTDMADHEALMSSAGRMWNQALIADACQALVDEYRAEKGLRPVAECTRRISYKDPKFDRINFHVELRDGKIHSSALNYFSRKPITSLAGIIRFLGTEVEMSRIRAGVA